MSFILIKNEYIKNSLKCLKVPFQALIGEFTPPKGLLWAFLISQSLPKGPYGATGWGKLLFWRFWGIIRVKSCKFWSNKIVFFGHSRQIAPFYLLDIIEETSNNECSNKVAWFIPFGGFRGIKKAHGRPFGGDNLLK